MAKKKKPLTAKQRSAIAKKAWKKQWKTETVEQWKARLKRHRAKIKREKSPEFKRRSEAGKKAWQTRSLNRYLRDFDNFSGYDEMPKETETDVYNGIISEIYAAFGDSVISHQLEKLMNITMAENDMSISEYIGKLDLNKISLYVEVIKHGSPRKNGEEIRHNIMALAEELTLNDLSSFDREELSDIIEQGY